MKITQCPECKADIIECDNNVYLDYPAVSYDERKTQWTLIQFSSIVLASVGQPSWDGKGHSLHEHQPPEDTTPGGPVA